MLCWLRIIDTSFAARFAFFSFRARPGLGWRWHTFDLRTRWLSVIIYFTLWALLQWMDGWMDGWIILLSSSRLWYGVKSWVENECESGIVLAYGSFVVGQWACTVAPLFV